MTKTTDPTVTTHAGHTIRLESATGLFYVDLGESHKPITDKSLEGLKQKLDERARRAARTAAAALPTVVFEWTGWSGDHKPVWFEGLFVAVNAHTSDISLTVKGQETRVANDAWFFRKGDPAIEAIRALAVQQVEAERAEEKAKKILRDALEKHGFQFRLGRYPGRNRAEQAAEAERKLVEHLGGAP